MSIKFDEKGKFFTDVVSKLPVPATIQTVTHRVKGNIHVREDQRVKDTLEKVGQFLAVTEATVYSGQGKALHECAFLAINLDQVVWVLPEENAAPSTPSTADNQLSEIPILRGDDASNR